MASEFMSVGRGRVTREFLDYEYRSTVTEEEGRRITTKLQRIVPDHVPGRFEAIEHVQTALRNKEVVGDPYLSPAIPDPHGPIASEIKNRLLKIPFGRPVKLHRFKNWTLEQLSRFLQGGDEMSVFYVSLTLVEQVWKTVEFVNRIFEGRIITLFACASNLVSEVEEDAREGYGITNLCIGDSITVYRQRRIDYQRRRHTAAQYACGFREVLVPPFISTKYPLFFPSTYGKSCGYDLVRMVLTHQGYDCDSHPGIQRALTFLRNGLSLQRGISMKRLHMASNILVREGVPCIFLARACRLLPSGNINMPTLRVKGDLARLVHEPSISKVLVFKIRYDGTLDTQSEKEEREVRDPNVEDEEDDMVSYGTRHYIGWCVGTDMTPNNEHMVTPHILNTVIPSLVQEHMTLYRNSLLLKEDGLPDLQSIWQINFDMVKENVNEAKKAYGDRKRKREHEDEPSERELELDVESQEGEESWQAMQRSVSKHLEDLQCHAASTYVSAMDIESFIVDNSETNDSSAEDDVNNVSTYLTEGSHNPFLINFSIFQLRVREQFTFTKDTCVSDADEILQQHDFHMETVEHVDGSNCISMFFLKLAQLCIERRIESIFVYGHNAAKYDWVLCLSQMRMLAPELGQLKIENPCYTSRGLISCTIIYSHNDNVVKMKLRDTMCFLSCSLAASCKSLGVPKCYKKKKFDFKAFTKEKFEKMGDEMKLKFYEYARYDIYSLTFCILRLEALMQDIYPIANEEIDFHVVECFKPRISFCTLQSLIRALLRDHYFEHNNEFLPNHFIPYDAMLLSALRGGCVQTTSLLFQSPLFSEAMRIFEMVEPDVVEGKEMHAYLPDELVQRILHPNHRQHTLTALDATSLYPTIMSLCSMPRGNGFYMDSISSCWFVNMCYNREFGRKNWGIFLVCITHIPAHVRSLPFGLISYRRKSSYPMLYCNACIHELTPADLDTLDMAHVYKKDDHYYSFFTTDHLAVYHYAGIEYEIHSGIAWKSGIENKSMSDSYKSFINAMYQKRKENASNSVLSNMYKLVMNGAFGSTGMRPIETKHVTLSRKHFTLDDTSDVPVIHYRMQHKHTDVANIKSIMGLMKDDQEIPNQLLIKLKSMPGHTFKALSCKSSCTSRVTSGSFRYMMEILWDVAISLHCGFTDILQQLYYMDTDSLFLPSTIADHIAKMEPYCHSSCLGGVKNDYGEGALILYMSAPLPKVRKMIILIPVKTNEGLLWSLKTVCKFKGLPLGPQFHHSLFETMLRDMNLQESKTVWSRNLQTGVSTHETSYKIDFQNMFLKSKSGIQFEEGARVVRLLPPYHAHTDRENENIFYFQDNKDVVMKKICDLFTF